MRKQVALVILLMVGFAGAGSSAVLTRALGQSKSLSAVQQEKRLGPKPTPHWFWRWVEWRLGEGYAKGHRRETGFRPMRAPDRTPAWAWQRLHFFLLARRERALAAAGDHSNKKHHGTPTTTTTTTSTTTTTVTTTTTGTTTTPSGGGDTYEQAISYTQTPPSFTPSRTVEVSNASELQAAISNLQAGDLVQATGSFTVSSSSSAALTISNRLSAPAEIDLTGVTIVYTGTQQLAGVWLKNASNLYIFGGDISTSDMGGVCLRDYGSQHVLWWGFTAHDCGGSGFQAQAIGGPVDHNDFQGTIWKVGQNLAWDPHAEKGTGLHGANLWDANQTGNFTNNRFAFNMHDIPTGACVEFGNNQPSSQATRNILYLKCVNATDVALTQTGGNALQTWGDTDTLGLDVKYLEGDNLQGFAYRDHGIYPGQNANGVTIEYGRVSNTNQNPRYAGQNPWQNQFSEVYQDVLPSP